MSNVSSTNPFPRPVRDIQIGELLFTEYSDGDVMVEHEEGSTENLTREQAVLLARWLTGEVVGRRFPNAEG